MSEVLVFSSRPVGDITSVLESLSSNYTFRPMSFIKDPMNEDFSKLPYIVICINAKEAFDTEDFYDSVRDACGTLNDFIKNNKIKSNIPIIPIAYEVNPVGVNFIQDELTDFIRNYPSLNLLKNVLIWSEEESVSDFKNKMKRANYEAGYTVSRSYHHDDFDLSQKSINISNTVNNILSVLIGFVLGTTAGGLIGGLVIGGVAATLIGTGIGLVAGPIIGLLIVGAIIAFTSSDNKVAGKREVDLQQQKSLIAQNELWTILKANLFPADSQEIRQTSSTSTDTEEEISSEDLTSDEEEIITESSIRQYQ